MEFSFDIRWFHGIYPVVILADVEKAFLHIEIQT